MRLQESRESRNQKKKTNLDVWAVFCALEGWFFFFFWTCLCCFFPDGFVEACDTRCCCIVFMQQSFGSRGCRDGLCEQLQQSSISEQSSSSYSNRDPLLDSASIHAKCSRDAQTQFLCARMDIQPSFCTMKEAAP